MRSSRIKTQARSQGEARDEAAEAAPPSPPPQPAAPSARYTGVADFEKPPEPPVDRFLKKLPDDAIPASSGSPPGSRHTTDVVPSGGPTTDPGTGGGDGNVGAAHLELSYWVFPATGLRRCRRAACRSLARLPRFRQRPIRHFRFSSRSRTIVGTAAADVIYAAAPDRMPSGTTERLIDVRVTFPDAGVVAKTATITNLPAGYAINNATQRGSNWIVTLDPADPSHLQLELRYVLPTAGTHPDANGFFGSFNLNILFGTTDALGANRFYAGSQTFVFRDITTADDVTIASADGKSVIYALNSVPPGANISAGGGDDLVYAGAGHDNLDGGTGNNTLSYKYSNGTVIVDLSAGTGSGGYAAGDTLQNFTNIEGSRFADRLTGTAGDNVFLGSGGGDTIIGNGGVDTADYSSSTVGVNVNLTTGLGSGGLADRDTLIDISNLTGSATGNNTLIGNSGANVLIGGSGNDVIDGAGGADTAIAGAGDDTVVYRGAEISIDGGTGTNTLALGAAVTVNLANPDQTVGDAVGVRNFQNVDASALTTGVSITGSSGVNVITGGSGADTIDGGGGADVINGGAGDDRIIYRGTEASINGGADTNTLVMLAQANVNLGNADQTSGDTTNVSNFQNVDASQLSAAQSVSIIGSAGVNILTGGAGNDAIDGGGGADIISGGAGDDQIAYRGTENAIDGGAGTNTLVLNAVATVNLGNADQTTGDGTAVSNFLNVNASALTVGADITGSAAANIITGGAGTTSSMAAGGADVMAAGAGNDAVTYHGTETSIDGGSGSDTLVLAASGGITTVDFAVAASADQTIGDAVNVTRFENLDASALATSLNVVGSTTANAIVTGGGDDRVDGGGGADVISTGAGNDAVTYRGTEFSIDGGTGSNTLALRDATDINLTRTDQSVGDFVVVSNFQNVDASALGAGQGVSIIGSAGANILTGGAGADTINGGGGAMSSMPAPATITFRIGQPKSRSTAVAAITRCCCGRRRSSILPTPIRPREISTSVANFQNVDGSLLTTGSTIIGSAARQHHHRRCGQRYHRRGGGADIIAAGTGNDTVFVHGNEVSIDGGEGNDTLVLPASSTVTAVNFAVAAGLDQTAGDTATVANFESLDAGAMATALTVTGSLLANTITTGSGNDIIRGGGGGDIISAGAGNDAVDYWGTETSIDGGTGVNTLVLRASATVDLTAADQTTGDSTAVSNFSNVDAQRGFDRRLGSGYGGREHYYRRCRRGYHRRRWRRRYHQCRCRQ